MNTPLQQVAPNAQTAAGSVPPAFLIGAGRSGTTLLYKLLCLHPDVGYISNYDKWLSPALSELLMSRLRPDIEDKLANWFNAEGNAYFVRRPLRQRLVATPVEGEFVYQRAGVPLIPAAGERLSAAAIGSLQQSFSDLARARGARLMLSKRTANNRRLPMIEQAFPEARYVYLTRDGRDVARSLARVEWWADHPVWWDGRAAKDIEASGVERPFLCVKNWVREVEALEESLTGIDPSRVLPLRFEQLLAAPRATLAAILEFLNLPELPAYNWAIDSLELSRKAHTARDWSDLHDPELRVRANALLHELGYTPISTTP